MNTSSGTDHVIGVPSIGESVPNVVNPVLTDLVYTVAETAKLLKCDKSSVYRLIYKGFLKICRGFGRQRVTRAELERFLKDVHTYDRK